MVSCIGNDELGEAARDFFTQNNIDDTMLAVHKSRPTGRVEVSFGLDGDPTYELGSDEAWEDIPKTTTNNRRLDLLYMGTTALTPLVNRQR